MTDFTETRARFHLPEGMIYLDGNSLGPMPKSALSRISRTVEDEWSNLLIKGWNEAGWIELPIQIADRIGKLIGAPAGSVCMGDTLSIKVYQALAAALALNPDRKVILSDNGNFPTDLYIAQGLIDTIDKGLELRVVDPEEVEAAITDEVAVMMLTEVDYRTGRLHDMKALTENAHREGVITVWDLAHSAGAIPVDLTAAKADFAVGCTYKYLNGGPGSPAFVYVAPKHSDGVKPALSGWLGHEAPFAFDLDYRPAEGVERMRVGTPPIIALSSLEAALDIWDDVEMSDVRERSIQLSQLFIAEVEARCPELELASPRDPEQRGSQVSFRFDNGFAAMQALIARDVIGDFRAPNIMRFGFTPLYLDEKDVVVAAEILQDIMGNRLWDKPEHHQKGKVT